MSAESFWLGAKHWREERPYLGRQGTMRILLRQWEEINDEDVLFPKSC